jgi:flagellar hook-length control protein FliK
VERAVVQQVFPEVTRVVSTAGNGTHRITLTLQPEQLGEVRVTLVVKDGSVHVRLAGSEGGDHAAVHRALASGAPELQRLLERSGTEARISVRDAFGQLTSTAATAGLTGPSAPTSQQTSQQTGQQTGQHTGQQAGPDAQAHEGRSDQAARDQPREHHDRRDARDRRHDPGPGHVVARPVVVPEPAQRSGRLDRTV